MWEGSLPTRDVLMEEDQELTCVFCWRHLLVRWPCSRTQSSCPRTRSVGVASGRGRVVSKPWREQVQMGGKRPRD